MSVSTQSISAGRFEEAYRRELDWLRGANAVTRLNARQACLWTSDPAHAKAIANRLGWLSVLDPMRQEAAALADLTREMNAAGLRDIVVLGTGASSLAAEVFASMFPAPSRRGHFLVLDSVDPAAILAAEKRIDTRRTLFVVASKSGKTIETLSQFFYFHDRVQKAGVRPPGDHFIAITDKGSYLEQLASEYAVRRVYRTPADINEEYAALSYCGLVPAALWGVDVTAMLDSGIEMRAACGPEAAEGANPALALGALMAAGAKNGADKVALLATPKLAAFQNWIEQLIARSAGEAGYGVVPVAGAASAPLEVLGKGCVNVAMSTACQDDRALQETVAELKRVAAPVVEIRLSAATEIGGEFVKWEAAAALNGAALGVDPFGESNAQESTDDTVRILEQFQGAGEMPLGTPRVADSQIEIFAEGEVRSAISTLHPASALRTFFAGSRPDDFIALLCYVARDAANDVELEGLRTVISERLKLPVLLSYGPRCVSRVGQPYRGGSSSGMFLVITTQKPQDVSIPGARYSFGQLQMAQALGDLQSLARRSKPALRVHLRQGAPAGLADLRKTVGQALAGIRTMAL